jgi:hypothetical protein
MLDEEMDDIIKKAANDHHPAYNDKAWEKMELQLDKHLPQKKDRRRLIFFLLFFLLLGGGILVTLNKFNNSQSLTAQKNTVNTTTDKPASADLSEKNSVAKNKTPEAENAEGYVADVVNSNTGLNNTKIAPDVKLSPGENKNNTEKLYNSKNFKSISKTKTKSINPALFNDSEDEADLNVLKNAITRKTSGKQRITITAPAAEEANDSKGQGTDLLNTGNTEPNAANEISVVKANTAIVKDSANTEKDKKVQAQKTEEKSLSSLHKKKKKNNAAGNFGLTFSVGPDVSFVKLNNTGTTTLTYGAGISYSFARRFTARAGFYVSKKTYEATADQYHTPGGNYPYLTTVNANCKVYEIPVSLAYNFGQRGKHNWFGNAGLSSFIMKKEDYTYNYKNPTGQTYSYYQQLSNQNKHYFAVLNLSAGYQYQLSKRLSVMAEPYVKLPLSGVGQGKIKLSSAGVLFTVTFKPFSKKK